MLTCHSVGRHDMSACPHAICAVCCRTAACTLFNLARVCNSALLSLSTVCVQKPQQLAIAIGHAKVVADIHPRVELPRQQVQLPIFALALKCLSLKIK